MLVLFYLFLIMQHVNYRISRGETQIIKAIAIVAMLVHHLFREHPEYGEVVHCIAVAGKICVTLFVFVSGYGLATTFPKNSSGCLDAVKTNFLFLGKRYAKFFLNYWVIFFTMVPIGVFCFGRTLGMAYGEGTNLVACFFWDALGQQGFNSYNITWWFNELILFLWLLFPPILYMLKRMVVAIVVLAFLFINPDDILYKLDIFAGCLSIYILPFCLGIAMALYSESINKILNFVPLRVVLCVSLIATISLFFLRRAPLFRGSSYFIVDPILTVVLALTVVCICRTTRKQFKPLQYVGGHSMNMYLTHTFILGYFFGEYVYALKYPIVMFIGVFAASLLVSIIIEFIKCKMGFYHLQNGVISLLSRQKSSACN